MLWIGPFIYFIVKIFYLKRGTCIWYDFYFIDEKKCVCELVLPLSLSVYCFAACLFKILLSWIWNEKKKQCFLFPRQICRLSSICLLAEDDQKKNSSLLAHIVNLPGFDASTARFATQYSTRCSPEKSVMEIVPTAAELMLPWRRDHLYPNQNSGDGGGGTLRLFWFDLFCFFNFVFNEIEFLLALLTKWCYHTHTHSLIPSYW